MFYYFSPDAQSCHFECVSFPVMSPLANTPWTSTCSFLFLEGFSPTQQTLGSHFQTCCHNEVFPQILTKDTTTQPHQLRAVSTFPLSLYFQKYPNSTASVSSWCFYCLICRMTPWRMVLHLPSRKHSTLIHFIYSTNITWTNLMLGSGIGSEQGLWGPALMHLTEDKHSLKQERMMAYKEWCKTCNAASSRHVQEGAETTGHGGPL